MAYSRATPSARRWQHGLLTGAALIAASEYLIPLGIFLSTGILAGYVASRARLDAIGSADLARLSREHAALRRLAVLVAQAVPPSEVFEAVTREVVLLCHADLARMERFEVDGTVTGMAAWSRVPQRWAVGTRLPLDGVSIAAKVLRSGQAARIPSYTHATGTIAREAQQLGVRSTVGCPIRVEGRLWGVIKASTRRPEPFPEGTESHLARFTELASTAIANAECRTELTASRARIVAASDETRRRIERDLHDGAQQRLISLGLELRMALRSLPADRPDLRDGIGRIADDLSAVCGELREMARGIHPAILSEGGLRPALRMLARRVAVPVELDIGTDARFPPPVEVAMYYAASEALANAAKHAHASHASVSLAERDGALELVVRDDGMGGADLGRGSGLIGLRDRVEAIGGTIEVRSPDGLGTTVHVRLPVHELL
jgi:signal transduction histidine kinase